MAYYRRHTFLSQATWATGKHSGAAAWGGGRLFWGSLGSEDTLTPPREQRAGSAGTAGATGRAGPGAAGWLAAGDTVTCDAAPWGQRRVGLGRCLRGGAAEAAGQA